MLSDSDDKQSACNAGNLGLIPDQEDHLEKGMATHSSGFLPGESHGQSNLAHYSLWSQKESFMTEQKKHTSL